MLGPVPLYLSAHGAVTDFRDEDSICSLTLNGSNTTLTPAADPALVFVNGRTATGDTGLKPGDVIGFTGSTHEFTLIRVLA